jgi:hypothetical protein
MCTFDINVCMRKDYVEMFSSHLFMFVYESSMSFYLFVLNGLAGSLGSFQFRRQNWRINRGWKVDIVQQEISSTL